MNDNFENELNLWNIPVSNAVEILRTLVDSFHSEKTVGKKPLYPSVLLIGDSFYSRILAKATSNSFGNDNVIETLGSSLGWGESPQYYFTQGNEHTTLFVSGIENLNKNVQVIIYKILKEGRFYQVFPWSNEIENIHVENCLLIMSVSKINEVVKTLRNAVDVCCNLSPLSSQEIFNMLSLLVRHNDWKCEGSDILSSIAQASNNLKMAIEIVEMANRISVGEGREVIGDKDVSRALHLLNENYKIGKEV